MRTSRSTTHTLLAHPSVQLWAQLAAEVAKDPCAAQNLLVDPLNEPDEHGLRWEATGAKPGTL